MQISSKRSALAVCALVTSLTVADTAFAAPASVDLRIEGRNSTIFEGPVTTDGKVVTPASGGDHQCDGTNADPDAAGSPGPTPVTTLDDGEQLGNYTWAGTWFPSFGDYTVDRVGPDAANSSQFWGQIVNSQFSQVGGCQEIVRTGDEVLWAYDAFSKNSVLRLSSPSSATTGRPFGVRVVNGTNGQPAGGATIGGATTDGDGRATLTYSETGIYRLKAERASSVRSNGVTVCVDPEGADPCTSTDKTAPGVTARVPGSLASERGRSRTLLVDWLAEDDANGSGVRNYNLEASEVSDGFANASQSAFETVVERTPLTRFHFRGEAGSTYRFRVTAVDRAANRGADETGVLSIPIDDRRLRLSSGWRRVKIARAWGQRSVRSTRSGATARLSFSGRRVSLIGRKLARGGRARVTVGGASKVLRLRGKGKLRRVLFTSRRLKPGRHTIRVRALGESPVEIDAVAPRP